MPHGMNKKYVVITRQLSQSKELVVFIEKLGYNIFLFPTIETRKNKLSSEAEKHLKNISQFDWIIFTSVNGVDYFMEVIQSLDIEHKILKKMYLGAVGPKTAQALKKYNLPIHFIPSQFTTKSLAKELPNIKDKKILLLRAEIANPTLGKILRKRNATVVNIPLYKTIFIKNPKINFKKLLTAKKIACITFTSPSTVKGFLKNIEIGLLSDVFSLPVVSIGPVTTNALKKAGFKRIYTSSISTIEGMITKMKESIL